MKRAINYLMDKLCEVTGHDLFLCYNRGEGRIRGILYRVWIWSWDLDNES